GTIHLGGALAEIARSEAQVAAGQHPERPYCIVAQPGVADPTRAPAGCQTLWGYCHVPLGSAVDMTGRIEAQIERFAPGFGDLILARSVKTAADLERYNPNYVGGDINGGAGGPTAEGVLPPPRPDPPPRPPPPGAPGVFVLGVGPAGRRCPRHVRRRCRRHGPGRPGRQGAALGPWGLRCAPAAPHHGGDRPHARIRTLPPQRRFQRFDNLL